MAIDLHIAVLRKGVYTWNEWRRNNPRVKPDLSGADLRGIRLCGGDHDATHYEALITKGQSLSRVLRDGADLKDVIFRGANLVGANLSYCDLSGADLSETMMSRALICSCKFTNTNLYWAGLDQADANNAAFDTCNLDRVNFAAACLTAATFARCSLVEARFYQSDLSSVKFEDTNLIRCDLTYGRLVRTRFIRGRLSDCNIYGVSVWDIQAEDVAISELCITPDGEPAIAVDDLDVAQFLYLILENKRLRSVIENMTGRIVLILGRFTSDRKRVLDALRVALRARGYALYFLISINPQGVI